MLRIPRPTLKAPGLGLKKSSKEDLIKVLDGPIMPDVGSVSLCGRKHAVNEDRVFHSTLTSALGVVGADIFSFSDMLSTKPEHLHPEEVLIAGVFDGHGGLGCVEYVSDYLPKHIAKAIMAEKRAFDQIESAVVDAFKSCDDDFSTLASKSGDFSGCCALVTLVHQNQVLVGWAGDSRAVFFDGKRAEQLSTDHRPSDMNEHKRILENGGMVVNNRLQGVLIPSRGFGDADVRSNCPDGVLIAEPSVTVTLKVDETAIRKQKAFLILASDGIWDALSNEAACEIVAKALKVNGNNAEAAAAKLAEEACKTSADDLSCVVITWSVVPWDRYSGIMEENEKM